MIFGSKALAVAVLGALVFSDEASAARMKKSGHDNNGLRKIQRELKGKGGGEGKGKGSGDAPTRADADEEETVEAIIDAVIDNKAGGDDITPDAMPDCGAVPVGIEFTDEPLCKYQYTANAPTRPCSDALQCTEKSRITKITFKYTSVPSTDGCTIDPNDDVYCPSLNKAEGGRVWIVENTDKFQDKLSNLNDPITYDMLAWYVDNDLDTAIPPGKTLYDEDVWVGDEFSINVTPSTLNYNELAYFAFDKNGNLITFAILMLDCSGGNKRYQIGNKLGNSEITSFMDSAYGVVTSTVFIDSYDYTVENNCVGTEPATVYSLKRTVSTSSCGEDHWVYSTAEGYNPFLCVAGGEIQLGCSGLPTIQPDGKSEFTDSIDGKGPINLLETKISLNVEAKIKYPEYWTIESTPEGGVNNRADDPPPTGGGDTSIDLCDVPALVPP